MSTVATDTDTGLERLDEVDWTFRTADTGGATHRLHPYPAKFIPQIPRTLIRELHPGDGTAVLDPFCGSGTTLVEAALAGKRAIGVDLSPIACLVSSVKTTPLNADLVELGRRASEVGRSAQPRIPDIPALDHWFRLDVQRGVSRLIQGIDAVSEGAARSALRVCLSNILVRVSNQESDTRYAAIEKDVSEELVFSLFQSAVGRAAAALQETWGGLFEVPKVSVLNRDVLELEATDISDPVSLVVTSPPYPNAYEYWLYHKYRMFWLGMDPVAVRKSEIGARPHYHGSNPQSAADFQRQMVSVMKTLSELLTRSGSVCFQVGDSVIRGELIDNSTLLTRAASEAGFRLVRSFDRTIPSNRKSFNPRHARIKKEQILVFRR
ncbi:DNA methyltransferase [Gaopeijia maritima]|uniref:DNA methyltransferase n=1 Tax=Gaopeijia maritima TaxID=3119007 RepID=UPI003245A11E